MPDALAAPAWLDEGRAIRNALVRDFAALPDTVVHFTSDRRCPEPDGPGIAIPATPVEEAQVVTQWAAEADWTLIVAPETRGLLCERIRWVDQAGGRPLGCDVSAVTLASDKWLTYQHFLNTTRAQQPRTRLLRHAGDMTGDIPLPWVCKPVDGAGCLDTEVIADPAKLRDRALPALVQEWIPGPALSASYLVGDHGCVVPVGVARQLVTREGDRFAYRGGVVPVRDFEACRPLAQSLATIAGLRGWVGVDFIASPTRGAVLLEVNPRPTTSFVGFQSLLPAGSLAQLWLDLASGKQVTIHSDLARTLARCRPIRFDCRGTITPELEAVPP